MMRADARMPPELLAFVQGIRVAREDHKTEQPLCGYLKSFGVCRSLMRCLCLGQIMPSQNVMLSGKMVFYLTSAVKYQYFSQRIWSFIF